ncbi:MAG: hypothetical protein HRT87_03505 [Legionellales bacterium]|nr:hypothetical protein [Legionellales bacterium]
MKNKILKFILLVLFIPLVHSKKTEPFYIQSGKAKLLHEQQLMIHEHDVKIDYANSHLLAEKVNSYFDNTRQLTKALIFGSAKKQAHFYNALEDDKPDFHAHADSMEYIVSDGKQVIHRNNVKIDYGESHLTANQVDSYFNDENKITKAFAFSKDNQQSHYWNDLESDKPTLHAYSDSIEYLPLQDNIIIHKNNVKIDSGNSHLKAQRVTNYLDDNNKLIKSVARKPSDQQLHYWNDLESDKPTIHAYSDLIEYLPLEDNVIIHTGNVKINNGESHLMAQRVNSYLDNNNKLIKSVAYRNKKEQLHYWEQNTSNDNDFHAYADLMEYIPDEDIVILTGNVTIKNAQGVHQSENVRYNLANKKIFSNNPKGKKVVMLYEVS